MLSLYQIEQVKTNSRTAFTIYDATNTDETFTINSKIRSSDDRLHFRVSCRHLLQTGKIFSHFLLHFFSSALNDCSVFSLF